MWMTILSGHVPCSDTPLAAHALAIFSHFCDSGHAETDYSGISKLIGGDAWDYEIDPSVVD